MGRSKALILATLVAAGASSAAFGADLLPPPPQLEPPPPMDVGGGWYLRGDVGVGAVQMSNWRSTLQPFDETGNAFNAVAVPSFASMGDQTFGGVGVGYQFNRWLRADITGEYRTEASYRANIMSAWTLNNPTSFGTDSYTAGLSTALFMANAYVDLGTWYGVTPFVGAGVGLASHKLSGLNDVGGGAAAGGIGIAPDTNQTNFAWAVMAGLALNVTPNLKMELGYRYVDMGSITSNPIQCASPNGCYRETQGFHVASQDVRLGFRYAFGVAPTYMPPLVTKY
jgi:opacity protein-like surface antigen